MATRNRSSLSQAAALIGRKGGRARTKAKTEAVRVNGRKGGRPRKPRRRGPWVAQGWPTDPLRPWTVLIVARTLMEKTVIEPNGFEHAIFPECHELTQRLGLPVVAYMSTSGTPPYTRYGSGDRSGVPESDREAVLETLTRTREMFGNSPPASVRDATTLRAWSVEQLRGLKDLLENAETAVAAGEHPWDTAARISEAAVEYVDALTALDFGDDFDDSGLVYPAAQELKKRS